MPGFLAALEPLDREQTFAVVATLGHYDEDALEPFVRASLPYVGLLAGAKRAAGVKAALAARGFESAELDAIHAPVGLDLGAVEPADVALSILAEIVAVRRALARNAPPPTDASRDPVCGMSVKTSGARYTAQHDGTTVFFCCAGCREAFIAEPSRYAVGLS